MMDYLQTTPESKPVDLVNLAKIRSGFRAIILQFGEVLYEKEKRDRVSSNTN
jgi:hypothetical protein